MRRTDLRRFTACICALLMLVLLLPVGSGAETVDAETVRVGYYENEVFQEGAAEGAVKTGYAYEYYRKLSEYTGWKYEYVYGGFSELYQMLLDGRIDLLAGLAYREDRTALISYPDAPMGSEAYYLVKQDTAVDITVDAATLNGKRIGVLDSAMVGALNAYLDAHAVTAQVEVYPDHSSLFEAFDARRLDALVAESDGSYMRNHAEVLCAFGSSAYYLCVNKARPDLLRALNEAQTLLAEEEPNYLHSLSTKYYSVSVMARAFSEAERGWLNTHDTLHVGYLYNYLPYSDRDEKGEVTGMVRDIVPAILEALNVSGVTVTYTGYLSYDDMIADMSSGAIDVAFPVGGGLYYSEENDIYQSTAVASASTEVVFRGVYGEQTLTHFAVNENNRMQYYYVRTNFPDAKITFYPSIDDCLKAVLSGEVTCTTLNGLRANDILKNSRYRSLSLHQTNRSDDRCFGVEIGNEGLLKILNRGISVVGTDYAQSIAYRYTGELYTYTIGDMIQDHIGAFILALLAIAALIFAFLFRDVRRTKKEVLEKEAARIELQEKNRALADSKTALAEALAEAEQANHAKTTFLSALASSSVSLASSAYFWASFATSRISFITSSAVLSLVAGTVRWRVASSRTC